MLKVLLSQGEYGGLRCLSYRPSESCRGHCHDTFLFITAMYTCACPKRWGWLSNKENQKDDWCCFRRGNRKQEIWMDGWRLVSGVQETLVRLRLPLVSSSFPLLILRCPASLFLSGTSLCQKGSSRFCSRVCLCINIYNVVLFLISVSLLLCIWANSQHTCFLSLSSNNP